MSFCAMNQGFFRTQHSNTIEKRTCFLCFFFQVDKLSELIHIAGILRFTLVVSATGGWMIMWVCLKIVYTPNDSHLIGIMIMNHWLYGALFSNNPIWRFPEIGVPPNHRFIDRIFHYKPNILGIPHLWKLPYILVSFF